MSTDAAQPIVPPSDFTVRWDDPTDAELTWRWDRWHFPEPIPPLAYNVAEHVWTGVRRGQKAAGGPVRVDSRLINGYMYLALRPPPLDDPGPFGPEEQPPFEQNHAMWDDVWLPRLQAFGARWERVDREALDAGGLLTQLDASLMWLEACWEIHGRLDFSADRWAQWCQRSLGWSPDRARELVVGLPNKSLEGDAALRALSAMVRGSEALAGAFAKPAGEVLATLPTGETTAAFRAAFADYLDRFGCRSDNFHDVSLTTWRENPLPVVALIKMYLGHPERGAIAEHDALIQRRDPAVEAARAELAARAPGSLAEFDRELGFARRCAVLNEDHNYWLDQRTLYWLRMDLIAAGRLLEERAVISQRDDVFFLTLDEVRSGLRGEGGGQVRLVAERRVTLEFQRTMKPPLELGIALAPGLVSGVESMFGGIVGAAGGLQLKGQPASRGAATGRARIITTLAEADQLSPGEILVAKTTSPPWTPLFGVAAAIVTDAGGALSHAAIVAREYGIPAVVGTVNATSRINDGQLIRVDGTAGTVDLLGAG